MGIKKIYEMIGLDYFPYAIGLSKIMPDVSSGPEELKDIKTKLQDLDDKKIDDALNYSRDLFVEESQRGEKIESKAFNLIGVTGISVAFVTGISSLIPKGEQSLPWLILLAILFITIVFSLTFTILLAFKVIAVGKYKYTSPSINNVQKMATQKLIEAKRDRLFDYIYCCEKNREMHNEKASYLIGAQLWFRNSVVSFLVLAFILTPILFVKTNDASNAMITQISIQNIEINGRLVDPTNTPKSFTTLNTYTPTLTFVPTKTQSISLTLSLSSGTPTP
jgi:hypothetical protein